MTVTPALAPVEAIVDQLVDGDITEGQALAHLRARGLTPDAQVLADAAHLLRVRDGLLDGTLDPYDVLDLPPRVYAGNMRDHAVAIYDADLCDALRTLTRPTTQRAAS